MSILTLPSAQEIIAASSRAGPSSYAGHDWLVVLNLGSSTALFLIALFSASDLIARLWRNRQRDRIDHPVTMFRVVLLFFVLGLLLRKGAAAAVLWKWNPADPAGTSLVLTLQRFLDPVADLLQIMGLALAIITARTLIDQLRKFPWIVPIWQSLPMLKRPLVMAVISFVAAFGVVMTR